MFSLSNSQSWCLLQTYNFTYRLKQIKLCQIMWSGDLQTWRRSLSSLPPPFSLLLFSNSVLLELVRIGELLTTAFVLLTSATWRSNLKGFQGELEFLKFILKCINIWWKVRSKFKSWLFEFNTWFTAWFFGLELRYLKWFTLIKISISLVCLLFIIESTQMFWGWD